MQLSIYTYINEILSIIICCIYIGVNMCTLIYVYIYIHTYICARCTFVCTYMTKHASLNANFYMQPHRETSLPEQKPMGVGYFKLLGTNLSPANLEARQSVFIGKRRWFWRFGFVDGETHAWMYCTCVLLFCGVMVCKKWLIQQHHQHSLVTLENVYWPEVVPNSSWICIRENSTFGWDVSSKR